MSLRDAFLHTKRIRTIVCPNSGFTAQLLKYEKRLKGTNSVSVPPGALERRISHYSDVMILPSLIRADLEKQGPLDDATKQLLLE